MCSVFFMFYYSIFGYFLLRDSCLSLYFSILWKYCYNVVGFDFFIVLFITYLLFFFNLWLLQRMSYISILQILLILNSKLRFMIFSNIFIFGYIVLKLLYQFEVNICVLIKNVFYQIRDKYKVKHQSISYLFNFIRHINKNNSFIFMTSRHRHCLRRSRKKTIKSEDSIFHLDEPEQAIAAKNDLLYHTSIGQKFYSFDKIRNRFDYQELTEAYESWHGQNFLTANKDKNKNSQEKDRQSLDVHKSCNQISKHRRYLLKSADFVSLKRKKPQSSSPTKKMSQSIVQMDTKSISIIPRMQSSVPSLKQTRISHMLSSKKKFQRNKSVEMQQKKQKNKKTKKINSELTIEGNCINIEKINQKLNEELKLKQKKGFLNLTLKHKQNRNKNWVTSMKRGTNVSKIDQFRTTNQPLKRQINKIIDLLKEQNKFKELGHYN